MEISPNVHWLETSSSNVYLIAEPPNIALVDTGMPKQDKAIFELLHTLGHQPTKSIGKAPWKSEAPTMAEDSLS